MAHDALDAGIAELAARLEQRLEELMDTIAIRLREEVPELRAVEQPEMWDPWRASTRANLLAALASLRRDRRPPEALPAESAEVARLTARAGGDLATLLRTYRVGHAVTWELWLEEVELFDTDAAGRRALREVASRFMFRFVD